MVNVDTAKRYAVSPGPPASLEFLELAKSLMEENNVTFPQTVGDAMD